MVGEGERNLNYLINKYRQERAGLAPWPLINTLSDDELRADLRIALTVPEGVGGVIGGWIGDGASYASSHPPVSRWPLITESYEHDSEWECSSAPVTRTQRISFF